MVEEKERKEEHKETSEQAEKQQAEKEDEEVTETSSAGKHSEEVSDEDKDSMSETEDESSEKEEEELSREELINKVNQMEENIVSLEDEKKKYENRLQRLQADFSNYRKRVKKEKEGLTLEAKIELINELLPVIDNFERALASEDEDSNLREGVEMIYKQMMNILHQQGLKVIPTEDEEFDHTYHEAIMQVEDTEIESGYIVEQMQKGYLLEGKVIRPAMVKVAK